MWDFILVDVWGENRLLYTWVPFTNGGSLVQLINTVVTQVFAFVLSVCTLSEIVLELLSEISFSKGQRN